MPSTFARRSLPNRRLEPPEVPNVATSTEQPAGIRGDGESSCAGVGELRPAHERQPSCSRASALRQYPLSPVRAQRSTGRGFGWQRFPNSKLSAMGLAYSGSGLLEYRAKPAHGVRCRLSDRRTRENCTYGGMGREWRPDHDQAREALPWGNPQQLIGSVYRR